MLPIVLHHGLFGFGDVQFGAIRVSYFAGGIQQALADRGHPLIVPRVHPTGSIQRRAGQLKETILRQLEALGRPDERVIIIGHSMGGLDARYMISRMAMADRVAALLTVCTPHRGSPYADWCVRHLEGRLGALQLLRSLGLDVQAVGDLCTDSCRLFNQQVPDVPTVSYFSISAARPWYRMPAFMMHSSRLIEQMEGDNDGVVSVRSAAWGRHLATWPADHLHAINKRLALEVGEATGDVTPLYVEAVESMLAEMA